MENKMERINVQNNMGMETVKFLMNLRGKDR